MRMTGQLRNHRLILPFLVALMLVTVAVLEARAHHMSESDIEEAVQEESSDYFPITHFYDILPEDIPGDPGTLIRSQQFDDYHVGIRTTSFFRTERKEGTHALRILYRSRDAHGEPSVSSGYVLIPPGETPEGGWPLIAYAHGTTGVARNCAPSLRPNRYDGSYLNDWIDAGFAIVATDYAGLGTDSSHQLLAYDAQAHDLIYSVSAAQAAAAEFHVAEDWIDVGHQTIPHPDSDTVPTRLSHEWVAIGHSQGGGTTIRAAELLRHPSLSDVRGYMGGVALAPGVRLKQLFTYLEDHAAHGFHILLHHGVMNTYPNFELSDVLREGALSHAHVAQNGCSGSVINGVYRSIPRGNLLKEDWASEPILRRFLRENTVGTSRLEGPLMVAHGTSDHLVPLALVDATVADMCANRNTVLYRVYEGAGHGVHNPHAANDVEEWVRDRFARKSAPTNC